MANLLDKFNKYVAGSRVIDADYNAFISPSGDFTRTKGIKTILQSWNNILLTPVGSYDHDPEYGSLLYTYIFEPADAQTQESIKDEIKNSIFRFDDRATILNIDVKFLPGKKGFNVVIEVSYEGEKADLSLTITETNIRNFLE